MGPKGISLQQRKSNILNSVHEFNTYLTSPRPDGSVLTNAECVSVAECAREAAFCPGCDELPADVCWRPGTDFYAWMMESNCCKHSLSSCFPYIKTEKDNEKYSFLARTVHSIVRHQHRLDENWYKCTLGCIKSLFMGSQQNENDEAVQVRCHQILCEILCISVTSHAIQMLYLGVADDIPDLPNQDDVEKALKPFKDHKVNTFDFMSFLKTVRRDNIVSDWSPFFTSKDIDDESPEYKRMDKSILEFMRKQHRGSRSPHTAIFFAPSDARAMLNVFEVLYLAGKEKMSMTTFPSKCGGITRFQMETVAAAYSGAVACKY